MRNFLHKTWVKAGLALMALPTSLAYANGDDKEFLEWGFGGSMDASNRAQPVLTPLEWQAWQATPLSFFSPM